MKFIPIFLLVFVSLVFFMCNDALEDETTIHPNEVIHSKVLDEPTVEVGTYSSTEGFIFTPTDEVMESSFDSIISILGEDPHELDTIYIDDPYPFNDTMFVPFLGYRGTNTIDGTSSTWFIELIKEVSDDPISTTYSLTASAVGNKCIQKTCRGACKPVRKGFLKLAFDRCDCDGTDSPIGCRHEWSSNSVGSVVGWVGLIVTMIGMF